MLQPVHEVLQCIQRLQLHLLVSIDELLQDWAAEGQAVREELAFIANGTWKKEMKI